MADVPHNRLTYGEAEEAALLAVLRSGRWAAGPRVQALEAAMAAAAGRRHGVAVSSGLSALRLALRALGIKPGDRVLVPAYSCVALANAVLAWGAQPIPVDVTEEEWNLDPVAGSEAVRVHKPAAAIIVHSFGAPARMDAIRNWGIPIIEDCAHAFGLPGFGGNGQLTITSFYATKLMGAGEGGMVLTNDVRLADEVRSWRQYADQPPDGTRLNDNMSDIEAALALCQLQRLPDLLVARRERAAFYHERLTPAVGTSIRLPPMTGSRVWYRYPVELLRDSAREMVARLARVGIAAAEPVTDWRPADAPAAPNANRAYGQLLSLPLYPTLTRAEQERVIAAFLGACQESHV
jgi:perosamine synthetase